MVLDASGYYVVRVNGEPRGGEKYGMDWVRHPVRLNKGRNMLLFQGERGRIRARLFDPPAPVFFADNDNTLPDIVIGESRALWAGIRLVNTTEDTIDAVEISYSAGERAARRRPGGDPTAYDPQAPDGAGRPGGAAEGPVQATLQARGRVPARASRPSAAHPPAQGGPANRPPCADLRE